MFVCLCRSLFFFFFFFVLSAHYFLLLLTTKTRPVQKDAIHSCMDFRQEVSVERSDQEMAALVADIMKLGFHKAHVEEALVYSEDRASALGEECTSLCVYEIENE